MNEGGGEGLLMRLSFTTVGERRPRTWDMTVNVEIEVIN
jgi:hypothetical protein